MLDFVFIFIIANIMGILYTLKRILRAIIENLVAGISISISRYLRIHRAEI